MNRATVAAVLAALLIVGAPAAHADDEIGYDIDDRQTSDNSGDSSDSIEDLICLQRDLGYTMPEIAGNLREADGRWQRPQANLEVWDTIVLQGACG